MILLDECEHCGEVGVKLEDIDGVTICQSCINELNIEDRMEYTFNYMEYKFNYDLDDNTPTA